MVLTFTAVGWPALIPKRKLSSSSVLSLSLYLISLGQGGYNPSLQAFGADHLEIDDELPNTKTTEQSSDKKRLFFQWWYFGVCCGSLLGVSLLSYVQDNFGWGIGFAIPAFALLVSIAIFTCGNRLYKKKQPKNVENPNPLENLIQSAKAAFSRMLSRKIHLSTKSQEVELE